MLVLMLLLSMIIGYLLGGVNGAIIISKCIAHEDVREKGSGNAGLTNFHRNYGGGGSLLVILIDVAKTVLACLIGGWLLKRFGQADAGKMLAGTACVIGHMFPAMFGFRGGKGILCGAALALAMDWRAFVIVFGLFLLVVILTRYISLGSIMAGVVYPFVFLWRFWGNWPVVALSIVVAALAIWMHRGNITRLRSGTERKFHFKKAESSET